MSQATETVNCDICEKPLDASTLVDARDRSGQEGPYVEVYLCSACWQLHGLGEYEQSSSLIFARLMLRLADEHGVAPDEPIVPALAKVYGPALPPPRILRGEPA